MSASTALRPALALVLLAACAPPRPAAVEAQPVEWRGRTYTTCQLKVAEASALERQGLPAAKPLDDLERAQVLQYITLTEHLGFGTDCGNPADSSGGFIAAVAADIPPDVEAQGPMAVDLYQDMRGWGHSPAWIRSYIDAGRFEDHMRWRRLVE